MYCTSCGTQMAAADCYCARCGKGSGAAEAPRAAAPGARLDRDMRNRKVAGVCAGIARHMGWDVTLVRIGFLAGLVVHGVGLIGYVIAWICMPRDDERVVTPS